MAPHLLEAREFVFLGPDHLVPLFLILAGSLLAIRAALRNPRSPGIRRGMRIGGCLLVLNFLVWQIQLVVRGAWDPSDSLPLHLCDASNLMAMLVLMRPTRLAFELLYFWGLAGAAQALLTPDIHYGFPDYDWFQHVITHGGIVSAALFCAFGLRMTPRKGAPLCALCWTNVVAVVAGLANWMTGGNYMFLAEPPPTGSLLDMMGPWPWYILSGELLAFALYWLLDRPFKSRNRESWPASRDCSDSEPENAARNAS